MNRAAGIIPARWASTRFPGKPLHLIANKPLLRHVWERCQRAKKLDTVIVDLDGNALYFSRYAIPFPRNRSAPTKYLRHPGIYGFRRKALLDFVKWKPTPLERAESLEQLRALENGVKVHVLVTKHGSPGVD